MPQSFGPGLPTVNIQEGHRNVRSGEGLIRRYLGGDPADELNNWLVDGGRASNDPDTTGWDQRQAGALWYNRNLGFLRLWNGVTVLSIPAVGGGVTDHGALTGLADDDHPQYHDGSLAYTGDLDMGGNDIVSVGLVDGIDISALASAFVAHAADLTIHFTEASIDHTAIMNIGTNSHADIDTHIADTTIHFTEASIDHTAIQNIGTNTHAQIDAALTALQAIPHDWHQFVAQSANPGAVPANTLWQDDGTNFTASTLVWGDIATPALFGPNFSIGNPGTEQGGINVGGVNYDATMKINSVGGSLDAQLILHRHSTTFPPILTFARTNDDTTGHTAVTLGQTLGSILAVGWSGSHYDIGAVIDMRVSPTGTVSATSLPTEMAFFTTPDGSDAALLGMLLGSDQVLYGGNVAGAILELQGAQNTPDLGIVQINSPVHLTYDTFSNTTPAQQFAIVWDPTVTVSALYIGGCLQVAPTMTITTGVFVPATFSDTSSMLTAATPGFSAFTFINELAVIENSGNFNLMSALVMNIGLTHERNTSGTSTTAGTTAVSFSPQTRTTVSGAILTKTNQTAVRVAPSFSTVAGSTANLGLITGVQMNNPAVALFQPAAGAETMLGYVGVDMFNIPFGGNVTKAAVRSNHTSTGTLSYFLLNNGNAVSDFAGSNIHFNDVFGIIFGNTPTTGDLNIGVIAGGTFFFNWTTGDTGQLRMSSEAPGNTTDRFLWFSTVSAEYTFDCDRFSLGAQTGSNGNTVGNFVTPTRSTTINGEWADFLLTHGGNLTIDDTMGDVHAWVINPISLTIGTGSITGHVNGLTVGMTTSNLDSAIGTQALFQRGRRLTRGVDTHEPLSPAAFTVDVDDYQPATFNSMRQVWRLTTDDLGAIVISGIVPQQNSDTQWITNVGTVDNISLGHQDAGSVAANRIISPTGANYVLGPNESACLWYDPTTTRWRILWGTGA